MKSNNTSLVFLCLQEGWCGFLATFIVYSSYINIETNPAFMLFYSFEIKIMKMKSPPSHWSKQRFIKTTIIQLIHISSS